MVYVTGDTHGDPERLSKSALKALSADADEKTLKKCKKHKKLKTFMQTVRYSV